MKRRDFVKTATVMGTGLILEGGTGVSLFARQVETDGAVKRVLVMFK